MVLGDLFSLISLAKSFADGQRDLNRAFFDDFMQPVWLVFTKFHVQYEKWLQDYAWLLNEEMDSNLLSEKIAENVFYSAALRLELSQLVRHNLQSDQTTQDKCEQLLSDFAKAMIEYFNSRRAFQTV